ncbi:MAG: 50S ribosomal protein L10 [Calditrichaeota bacterium]|nr:MAG: 50S ribosomal protein L10 [Calditrichota bacterium]
MPTPQKEAIVKEMTEKFSRANSVFLADFTGIDVNTINQLRRQFREARVEYRVLKNTLAKLSLHNAGITQLDEYLTGVNGYVISYDDPTLPVKVVEKLKKDLNDKFKLKAAYFEGQLVGTDQVASLAKLPSKQELLGQLCSMLQSPMTKLAGTLNAAMQNLVGALKALEEAKKEQQG